MNQIIANSFVVVLGYGFLVNLIGLKMGSYIMAIFLSLNMMYCVSFYLKQKYVKKLLQKKDKRMSYLRGVIQNLEWVKIRALENFFSIKIFKKRELEIKQLIRNISALAVSGLCDWSVPNCLNLIMISGFTVLKFLDIITFGTFTGLLQVMATINNSCYTVMATFLYWAELNVSIKRVELFFNLEELPNLKIKNEGLNHSEYLVVGKGEKVISIKNGEFCWESETNQQKMSVFSTQDKDSKVKNYDALTDGMNSLNTSSNIDKTKYGFFSLAVPKLEVNKGEMVMIVG